MTRLQGCGTALVTPFTERGDVDYPALHALVEWQIAEGIDFLATSGTITFQSSPTPPPSRSACTTCPAGRL